VFPGLFLRPWILAKSASLLMRARTSLNSGTMSPLYSSLNMLSYSGCRRGSLCQPTILS
jgi:hypothetical protein